MRQARALLQSNWDTEGTRMARLLFLVLGSNDRVLGRLQAQIAARFTKRCVAGCNERRGSLGEGAAGRSAAMRMRDARRVAGKGGRWQFCAACAVCSTAGLGWRGCGRFGTAKASCRPQYGLWPHGPQGGVLGGLAIFEPWSSLWMPLQVAKHPASGLPPPALSSDQ